MARYCANCGTEVDESAAFCPTCGQPIDDRAEVEIPPAPPWPEQPSMAPPPAGADAAEGREPEPAPGAPPPSVGSWATESAPREPWPAEQSPSAPSPWREEPAPERWSEEPITQPTSAPPPAQGPPAHQAPTAPRQEGASAVPSLPITWPVMLSGWLIGGGAVLASIGAAVGLFSPTMNAWDVVLLVLFLAIAFSVFFSASMPAVPQLRLITMVIALVGLGVALDRLGFGVSPIGTLLLLLGTGAAAIGAVILELGRDQPLGGGQG